MYLDNKFLYAWIIYRSVLSDLNKQTKDIPLKMIRYNDWTENYWKNQPVSKENIWKSSRKTGELLLKTTLKAKGKHGSLEELNEGRRGGSSQAQCDPGAASSVCNSDVHDETLWYSYSYCSFHGVWYKSLCNCICSPFNIIFRNTHTHWSINNCDQKK